MNDEQPSSADQRPKWQAPRLFKLRISDAERRQVWPPHDDDEQDPQEKPTSNA